MMSNLLAAAQDPTPLFGIGRSYLNGQIIECDDVYASIMQMARSDLIGRNLSEFAEVESYSPDAVTNLVLLTKQPVLVNRAYVRADGSKIHCITQICIIWNADGSPHSTLAVVQLAPTAETPPVRNAVPARP